MGQPAPLSADSQTPRKTSAVPPDLPQLPSLPPLEPEKAGKTATEVPAGPETAQGVYREAEETVQRLLDRAPDSPDCQEVMARLLLMMGKSGDAEKHWKRALDLNPNYAYAYDGLAEIATKRGDYEEAVRLYRKSLAIVPKGSASLLELCRALARLGRTAEAVESLRQHVDADSRSVDGHLLLGEMLLRKQDYAGAKQAYLRATALAPERPHAWYGLGTACQRLNQPDEARQHFDKSTQMWARAKEKTDLNSAFSDAQTAHRDVAKTYSIAARIRAALGNVDEAARLWRKAATLDPTNPDPKIQLALFYLQAGRKPDALPVVESLKEMRVDQPLHYLTVAVLLARLGQFDQSEAMLARCREMAPGEAWSYRESARFYIQTKQKGAEALRLAQKAVELEPAAGNYAVAGQACMAAGDREGARAALRKARELEPTNNAFAEALKQLESAP
jgi:tetratricopeptide (TPR) repeat protein